MPIIPFLRRKRRVQRPGPNLRPARPLVSPEYARSPGRVNPVKGMKPLQGKQRPGWALSGWGMFSIFGKIIDRIIRFVYPRPSMLKRRIIGTGFGPAAAMKMAKIQKFRRGPMTRAEEAQAIRQRNQGLTAAKGHQFSRTYKIAGVPKHPESKAKAA